jgi:hypothetical protein
MFGSYGLELVRQACLFALFALVVLFVFFRRSLVDFDRWQQKVSLAARAGLLVLLILGPIMNNYCTISNS